MTTPTVAVTTANASAGACEVCGYAFGLFVWRHGCKACKRTICAHCSVKQPNSRRVCVDCARAASPASTRAPTPMAERRTEPVAPLDSWRLAGRVHVHILEARGLLKADRNLVGARTSSDPYVVTSLSSEGLQERTRTVKSSVEPVFDEQVVFELEFPISTSVQLRLFDEDVAARDDLLGEAEIPVALCDPNVRYEGWLCLRHPDSPRAGMVHVAVLLETTVWSELYGRFRHEWELTYPCPPETPPFNVDELYSPLMLLAEIVGNRLCFPIANQLVQLVFWQNPLKSTLALALWIPLSHNVRFWPSLLCLALTGFMHVRAAAAGPAQLAEPGATGAVVVVAHKSTSAAVKTEVAPESQSQSLGGFVNFSAKAMPGDLKEWARNFQLPLKTVADTVFQVYEVFHWRSSASVAVFRGLFAASGVLLFLPFHWLVMAVGLVALLVFSPLAVAAKTVGSEIARRATRRHALSDDLDLQSYFDATKAAT